MVEIGRGRLVGEWCHELVSIDLVLLVKWRYVRWRRRRVVLVFAGALAKMFGKSARMRMSCASVRGAAQLLRELAAAPRHVRAHLRVRALLSRVRLCQLCVSYNINNHIMYSTENSSQADVARDLFNLLIIFLE